MHPIIKDLNNRYTCKKYDPAKKVSQADLDILHEAIRLSASSINSQPWRFVVIESDEAKQRMHDTFVEKYQFNQQHVFESSQIILFAHNTRYTRDDYAKVVDQGIEDGRTKPGNREKAFGSFMFAQMNTDESGFNGNWTKAQLYIALGNTLHTLARLGIDATPLEGIDVPRVAEAFKEELGGYICEVALAVGYHSEEEDFNAKLPKSRLKHEDVFVHA